MTSVLRKSRYEKSSVGFVYPLSNSLNFVLHISKGQTIRFYRFSSLFLAYALLLSFFLVIQAHAESTWTIQTVSKGANGTAVSIVLDSDGNPHIAYSEYTNGSYRSLTVNLTYAVWNDSAWTVQTLGSQVYSTRSSLALDSFDNPHICYLYKPPVGTSYLMYTHCIGSNWTTQTIDEVVEESTCSLALDSNNNPHISYSKGNNLMYATWIDSSWSIQTLDSTASIFFYDSTVNLDSKDYPHIIYGDAVQVGGGNSVTLADVKYAEWDGSSWSIQIVFSNVNSFGNIALDSNWYPHFTYIVGSSLRYASWDGSTWNTQTVDSNPLVSSYPSGSCFLALDNRNNPHISYYRYNSGASTNPDSDVGLIYAYQSGSAWNIQTVDNSGTYFGVGPITLDSDGNPHIIYQSEHLGQAVYYYVDIKYATRTESTPTPSPPTSLSDLQLIVIVAVVGGAIISVAFLVYRIRRKGAKS
jgi:hypothetical protein